MSDRKALISRLEALTDEELDRIVEFVDSGVFGDDPIILEERAIMASEQEARALVRRSEEDRMLAVRSIPSLVANESFQQLQQEVLFRRERHWHRQARKLAGGLALSQDEVDYQRGYWNGALWAVSHLPKQIEEAIRRFDLRQKESDRS